MSITRCTRCERQVDTDFEEMSDKAYDLHGAEVCLCCEEAFLTDQCLGRIRKLADEASGGDYVRIDGDGRAGRVTCDWPWALASATLTWLNAGRPAETGSALWPLLERVLDSGWGVWWDDPGVYPSNAGGSALPSRCDPDSAPNDLATEVSGLLEDMGIEPVKKAA